MQSPPVYKQETYMPKMFFKELAEGRIHYLSPIITQYKHLRLSARDVSGERTASEAFARLLLLGCANG